MRLVTYRDGNRTHVGALREDGVVALDAVAPDMLTLIDGGAAALAQARTLAAEGQAIPLADVTLLAPIPRPRQNVICLGMNYVEHAYESERARGREPRLPQHPVFFTKAVTTIANPEEDVPLDPAVTAQLDYEVELAFIIGTGGKNIAKETAMDHIFGYTIVNDLSARDLQNQHLQFFKGKSLDKSCPIGPYILTADEVPDVAKLGLRLRVNGETRQESFAGDLIFDIPTIIATFSHGTTIEAGTIFSTGTPSGVGMGRTPPEYLNPGDLVEAEIDKLGVLRNRIVAA
ncbi:MAG: fumarylacetoacetate hydrolase family protein [Roseiflexaceae bacterium]|nr:fumarylacetoacetate hydrolase family protein [Roseiflexaceae bacterium]